MSSGDYRDEGIIDVERRRKQAEYILGDPTLFPVEFLNWIVGWIARSGLTLPASAIIGGFKPGSGSVRNLAPGIILPFAGAVPPSGSLVCDGGSYVRTEQALLFAEIGTTWGSNDALTFKVPDLRDRALFGAGALALGTTDPYPHGSRGPSHHHFFRREIVSLQPGGTQYSIVGNQTVVDSPTTGGTPKDVVGFASIHYVITTGQ